MIANRINDFVSGQTGSRTSILSAFRDQMFDSEHTSSKLQWSNDLRRLQPLTFVTDLAPFVTEDLPGASVNSHVLSGSQGIVYCYPNERCRN